MAMDTAADTVIAAALATDTVVATAVDTVAATAADIAEPQLAADTTVAVVVVDSTVVAAVTVVVVDTGNCSSVDLHVIYKKTAAGFVPVAVSL
jgi:hypothetical protein